MDPLPLSEPVRVIISPQPGRPVGREPQRRRPPQKTPPPQQRRPPDQDRGRRIDEYAAPEGSP